MAIHAPITGAPAGATPLPHPPVSIPDTAVQVGVAGEYLEALANAATMCLDSLHAEFRARGLGMIEPGDTAASLLNLMRDQARIVIGLGEAIEIAGRAAA